MRLSLQFAASALVAGLIGLSPAFAQQPPSTDAELKKALEQLEKQLQELRTQEAKKAAPKAPPTPPPPPTPTAQPSRTPQPMIFTMPAHPAGDAAATLKSLLHSKDPKTAALAKELLAQLAKSANPAEGAQFQFHFAPSGDKPPAFPVELGQLELKIEGNATKPGQLEFKIDGVPGVKAAKTAPATEQKVERRVVVVGDMHKETAATSSLKMSADGKTAAVVGTDGTVIVYDVATGKELMKFPGKK